MSKLVFMAGLQMEEEVLNILKYMENKIKYGNSHTKKKCFFIWALKMLAGQILRMSTLPLASMHSCLLNSSVTPTYRGGVGGRRGGMCCSILQRAVRFCQGGELWICFVTATCDMSEEPRRRERTFQNKTWSRRGVRGSWKPVLSYDFKWIYIYTYT